MRGDISGRLPVERGGIYALVDTPSLKRADIDLASFCGYLDETGITIAQYRNKISGDEVVARELEIMRSHFAGTIIVNDRIEFVRSGEYADGLHLGQEDLLRFAANASDAVKSVKMEINGALLGISTHNLDEILEANTLDIDYIGLGAYRSSDTKKEAREGGDLLLEYARRSTHPVALIGGLRWSDRFGPAIACRVMGGALYERYLARAKTQ